MCLCVFVCLCGCVFVCLCVVCVRTVQTYTLFIHTCRTHTHTHLNKRLIDGLRQNASLRLFQGCQKVLFRVLHAGTGNMRMKKKKGAASGRSSVRGRYIGLPIHAYTHAHHVSFIWHIYTYANMHTHIHTKFLLRMHLSILTTCTCTHIHMRTNVYLHTHTHTCIHIHMRTEVTSGAPSSVNPQRTKRQSASTKCENKAVSLSENACFGRDH